MNLSYPSPEFDDAVADLCHGNLSTEQAVAMNQLLLSHPGARDEYLFRVELHARLGAETDLGIRPEAVESPRTSGRSFARPKMKAMVVAAMTVATAIVVIIAATSWRESPMPADKWIADERTELTSHTVALLDRVFDAEWEAGSHSPSPGSPLEPGWLHLKSGMAQIVFYSGARVLIQGPADIQLISQNEASCSQGQLIAEVPPQAQGFQIGTPKVKVTDLGTSFGLLIDDSRSEVHVFSGEVLVDGPTLDASLKLEEGRGAIFEDAREPQSIVASPTLFAPLYYLETASELADAAHFEQFRIASKRLNQDSSLLVHLDFEGTNPSAWRLRNAGYLRPGVPDASIVGCQWTTGRWDRKRALEFQGVTDRVRLCVPGEFNSLTISAWVRVQGLDRQINSLFMSDGFVPGSLHWSIRSDGVLGLTAIGSDPGDFQIIASRPSIKVDRFGRWIHLAVVLDGKNERVEHFIDGLPVGGDDLRIVGPFHIGTAELGNWNSNGFSGKDPFHMRNFSGAIDEFLLYARALSPAEILNLYSSGSPEQLLNTTDKPNKKIEQ